MRLYWFESEFEETFLGTYETAKKLWKAVYEFLQTNYIKSYYQRLTVEKDKIWIDYGGQDQYLYVTDYTEEQLNELTGGE